MNIKRADKITNEELLRITQ